ncbi:MAG: hypothetical protein U0805_11980 [Pirellulales bacterium]
MSHESSHHEHHGHNATPKRGLHRDWRLWAIVILMLAAIGIYVATNDEAIAPGVKPAPPVPAAP